MVFRIFNEVDFFFNRQDIWIIFFFLNRQDIRKIFLFFNRQDIGLRRKFNGAWFLFFYFFLHYFFLFSFLFVTIQQLNKLREWINRRLLFENKDPRCLDIEDIGLSKRLLIKINEGRVIMTLKELIVTVLNTPEYLLEIEGLDDEDRNRIFAKIHEFVNSSYALTALFYSNDSKLIYGKLIVKPWWYILILMRKDPVFRFITELDFSPRVRVLLLGKGIYTIDELRTRVSDTWGCVYLIQFEDFQYEDFFEIFTKLEWWYRIRRKTKDSVFRFITELDLSRRVRVLLMYKRIYRIDELRKILKNHKTCKALLEEKDFEDENFFEIFTKLEWWYRIRRKTKNSVFRFITELDFSPRVTVLLLRRGIYTIDDLKGTVRDPFYCKVLLETEGFEDEDFFEIFTKLEWWYRIRRKTKDSVFRFITELDFSPRVTVLLLYQHIYTIDDLKVTVRDPFYRKVLLETEGFEDEDFFEIFTKLESWYRYKMIRKTKDPVFSFITEYKLSPRVTVLLLRRGISRMDQLRKTLKDPKTREVLLEMQDFKDEDLLEIFRKVDWR